MWKCKSRPHAVATTEYRTKKHPRNTHIAANVNTQQQAELKTTLLNYFHEDPTWFLNKPLNFHVSGEMGHYNRA
jgi:hypothetical protein